MVKIQNTDQQILVKMRSNRTHTLLVGISAIWYSHLEVWQFLTKLNIILPHNLAITLGIHRKSWKFMSTQNLHTVYSNFIHNYQILEATKMSFSRRMIKQWHIQTMSYSTLKRNELSSHKKTWKKLVNITKTPTWKGYILFPTVWHFGKDKIMDSRAVVASGQGGSHGVGIGRADF